MGTSAQGTPTELRALIYIQLEMQILCLSVISL